jgi:hypothetical protein
MAMWISEEAIPKRNPVPSISLKAATGRKRPYLKCKIAGIPLLFQA